MADLVITSLPKLKNNELRKKFLEEFQSWKLWIDNQETQERYYRLDISERNESIVVRTSKRHMPIGWDGRKYIISEVETWSKSEYYLLKADRFFADCETCLSSLIEYLREIQKNNTK